MFDLVREFKNFKSEAKNDIFTIKLERESFKTTIRNAELSIGLRVTEMQKLHSEFALQVKERLIEMRSEIERANTASTDLIKQAQTLDEFIKKSFELSKILNEKLKTHEKEIKDLKIKVGGATIFKGTKP